MPLKIDLDIAVECQKFNLDPALVQAVRNAEGGTRESLFKAVQCSIPKCRDEDEAVHITCRSAVHAMSDFIATVAFVNAGLQKISLDAEFVKFWAKRWAPQGVSNDPTNLNKNWPVNVLTIWRSK